MNRPSILQSLVYRVDADNRISWVNEVWSEFALANLGASVMPPGVIGRDLLDSVSDSTVREIYRAILFRVRAGAAVEFNYRCDAPDKRRIFEMRICALDHGGAEFASTLLHEEIRPTVLLLEPGHARNESFLRVCSWCQKVATPDGQWLPVEEAAAQLRLLEVEQLPAITHGICAGCYAEMKAKLGPG